MAKIILNGRETDLSPGEDLFAFLRARNPGAKNLILELNGRILTERDPLETFSLKDGDVLNLFSMVGGG